MKKLVALAFALSFFSPTLLSQTGDMKMPMTGTVESQVTDLEKQGVMAAQKNDPSFMQSYYADDYIGVTAMGKQIDRQTAIDDLKTGRSKYEKLEISDRKVTQYGPDAAVVRGKAMVKAMVNGQPLDGTYAFSRTWIQRDGKWQVVAFQSTKIP